MTSESCIRRCRRRPAPTGKQCLSLSSGSHSWTAVPKCHDSGKSSFLYRDPARAINGNPWWRDIKVSELIRLVLHHCPELGGEREQGSARPGHQIKAGLTGTSGAALLGGFLGFGPWNRSGGPPDNSPSLMLDCSTSIPSSSTHQCPPRTGRTPLMMVASGASEAMHGCLFHGTDRSVHCEL